MNAPISPLARLAGFVGFVRANGFSAGIAEELDAVALAAGGDMTDGRRLRWELKSLLCSGRRDWERFDELFDAYFRRPNRRSAQSSAGPGPPHSVQEGGLPSSPMSSDRAQHGDPAGAAKGGARGGASRRDGIGQTDFRELADDAQMRAMEQLVEHMARRLRERLRRRMEIARLGRRIHMRRTIRASLARGGTPMDLVLTRKRRQPPRLVVILDVSRSMSLYSFLFLRFARGIVAAFRDAEAFVFHTRLVHVTDALRQRDLLRVREKLTLVSLGWSGGTRIGESLQRFSTDHAGRLLCRSRSIVVIVSDGLDTGPPEDLAAALAGIKRRARRLVWLNPLLGRPGYEPLAGGMQAALPHVDLFAPAHNLDSLMALEQALAA